jgi:D-alanine-D-alanine ligase
LASIIALFSEQEITMKIAVIYNRDSNNVINLFGIPNLERYGNKTIGRIVNGLRKYGHQVKTFEGDKDLITNLEQFMPKVLKGERPGMAFNVSYGIQGQARYTHVPGILEMVGVPYVGSGPLAHSLALDKVVAKMIFLQYDIPTPPFTVLSQPGFEEPQLPYPLIVKPKNEAVSMGIQIVQNEQELRKATEEIFNTFGQPALVETYIEGREINVGLLGNNPPEALPPCEIVFDDTGPAIYTIEDKRGKSGRKLQWLCPAPLTAEQTQRAKDIAQRAFNALGCFDAARVDMRLNSAGDFYVLEINSLPSLREHSSYVIAAKHAGLEFPDLINRLVEVAGARYFGTQALLQAKAKERDPQRRIFSYITERRDLIEKRLEEWTKITSRTSDPVGNSIAVAELDKRMQEINMKQARAFTDTRSAWTWETPIGFQGGTLFIGHIDVPLESDVRASSFHREPEWLVGEGIGLSRASLTMIEYALRSLRHNRMLHQLPLGVLYYLDEGRDCRYSAEIIRSAAAKARRVLVLRPGSEDNIIIRRRGQRKYNLTVVGKPQRVGRQTSSSDVLLSFCDRFVELAGLSSSKDRVSLTAMDIKTSALPALLPHQVTATLVLSYQDSKLADVCEKRIMEICKAQDFKWSLQRISDRPAMNDSRASLKLFKSLAEVARRWDIPLGQESSLLPSAAGLVPIEVPVICGVGPVARDLYTPQEAVNRISLIQRTLLTAEFLAEDLLKAQS